ncbi:transmembrane protein, partial [Cupriavidus sp. HMR-1]
MTLYQAFETLVVPLIVLACALHVVGRYMPRTRERLKASLAAGLGGASASGWRG